MRRYWMISLLIGGGAAALTSALFLLDLLRVPSDWIWSLLLQDEGVEQSLSVGLQILELVIIFLMSIGTAWAIVEATRLWQKWVIIASVLMVALLLWPTLFLYEWRFNLVAPLVAVVVAAVGAMWYGWTEFGRRKARLEEALGDRVSAKVFSRLLERPEPVEFSACEKGVSTLVCRLLSYTSANTTQELEGSDQSEIYCRLASLFSRTVSGFLLSRGAYVESVRLGEVKVSFGMLEEEGEDVAMIVCQAALELQGRLRSFSRDCRARWSLTPITAIGVSTSTVIVGLCDDGSRKCLANSGEAGQFGSRLAFAGRRYGTDILICAATLRLVEDRFEVRPVELLFDPHTQCLSEVYQLLSTSEGFSEESRSSRDAFWQGVIQYRSGDFSSALASFQNASVAGLEDPLVMYWSGLAQERMAVPPSRSLRLVRELTAEGKARLADQL